MALTGLGLFAGSSGARWAAVFFVIVNAIAQIVWFPAAPLWAFLMIILDVTIILPADRALGGLTASGRRSALVGPPSGSRKGRKRRFGREAGTRSTP